MADSMTRSSKRSALSFISLVALTCAGLWAGAARADLAPTCDQIDSLVTCAATDVGKECQGGGHCFEMGCSSGSSPVMKVYKCVACPTIIDTPAGTCTFNNSGASCSGADGGSGTCAVVSGVCNSTADKAVCQVPSTETPTGPPAGSTAGGGDSGGCDVAPRPTEGSIGIGLLIAGFVFVVIERVRRRRRSR
jgi:hypothetical protein